MGASSRQHLTSCNTTALRPLAILLLILSVFVTACGGGAGGGSGTTTSTSSTTSSSTGGSSSGGSTSAGDTTLPTIAITSPTTGTTVSGTITVSATASDNIGVAGVQFKLDGVNLGTEDTSSPYSTSWTTTGSANGTHTLTATARDAAGNKTTTLSITITVSNTTTTTDTTAPTVPTGLSATAASSSQINLSWTAATDPAVSGQSTSGVAGYRIYRNGTQIATLAGASYSDTALASSTTYTYTIAAYDAAGNVSAQSAGANATTQTGGTPVAGVFYISSSGSDSNSGTTSGAPWKTFSKAFSTMKGGDELILLDGAYGATQGTGYISYLGTNSAQPPSGTSLSSQTYIHALNPGNVTINGSLFIGRSTRKDSFIKIQGITFEGGGNLYNTSYVTIKDCGFHGGFSIGTNDHDYGNDYDLVEDVWVWTSGARIIAINYRSHHNVWRRVVVRGDGCGTSSCTGSGNPNVGITVYNSMDVSLQNVMVVDRILASGDEPYADFAVAQHDPGPTFGRAEWLGTISLNSPDSGYYMEPDVGGTVDPTIKISNAVAWNATQTGFNIARSGTNNLMENLTAYGRTGDGVRVDPNLTSGTLRNVISANAGRYGINSKYTPSYADVYSALSGVYNQTTCSTGCYTSNPQADGATPSVKYLTRVESGSLLKGKGYDGADIGANVQYRYGTDGTRFGDSNYNTLSSTSLWPWPNEDRIKREMCSSITRGFCTTGQRLGNLGPVTLTTYIWEYLGNSIPAGIYP